VTYFIYLLCLTVPNKLILNTTVWKTLTLQFIKLYNVHFSPISYYFQPKQSMEWSVLLPNPDYSCSLMPKTRGYTTFMKIPHKHTFVFQQFCFQKAGGRTKVLRLKWALLQINFLSISWFCNLYSLAPLKNNSSSPTFQNFKQCIPHVKFFYGVISPLSL